MLQQHNKFEDSLSKIWEDYISRFTIDQVLDKEHGMKVSRDSIELSDWEFNSIQSKLRKLYDRFDHRYKELVNDGMIGLSRTTQMNDIISYAQNTSNDRSLKFDEQILELMACLFSYWTLSKIKKSNDQDQTSDSDSSNSSSNSTPNTEAFHASVLIKPHAGQIIALLRIFGLDSPSGKIDNHIIEILTGEGKSIVLGVTATILALLGYSVDCVCYSSYLSKRDKESFSYLFKAFEVDDLIHYGTLTELCEKTIEDLAGGSIRENVLRSFGINSSGTHKFTKSSKRKVLLMDEVDMFFNEDFYGNAYTPVARLVDPTITDVVNYIWSLHADPKNFNISKVLKSNQLIACKNRFHQYSNVIEESVKYMFFQLKELLDDAKAGREPSPAHVPYVVLDTIAYKDQDSLSSNISLGYKTMWTYFIENAKRNITDKSRDSQICIRLDCGQYSIAEVPKLYEHILGVSGTITALMNDKVLTDAYNIHKETKIPSVYGQNKLRFTAVGNYADIKISTEVSHFIDITNEITKQSEAEIDSNKFHRPVLVFFESIAELNKYYNSPSAQKNKNRTKILTEREPDTSKTNLIRHATNANTITLLTREFGRGIDFIVYDEKVRRAGGPHAIQTFFSEGISEEIQIKGRTARQGGDGSYSMVLSLVQLEKFKSGSDSLMSLFDSKEYGPVLDNLRIQYVDTVRGSMALRVNSCMPQHNMSLDFINSLVARNLYKINEYLELFNKCPNEYLVNTNTRVLVLMDATGSMSACITNAKNAVGEMFKQIQIILKENNVDSSFEIQFAVYRNYNAPMDQIIEWSEWTSDPSVLYSFIEKIKALFGLGREAVEMGLWHLNREMAMSNDANKPISRVILIGDQPPNTSAEVVEHRQKNHGEAYWISKKIGPATTYLDQLKLIKQKNENIMINSFYLNGETARSVFTEIAANTGKCLTLISGLFKPYHLGGVCKSLDVSDVKKAAQFLCGHAAVNILDAINNNSTKLTKGQLVEAYTQMFKGYIQ